MLYREKIGIILTDSLLATSEVSWAVGGLEEGGFHGFTFMPWHHSVEKAC